MSALDDLDYEARHATWRRFGWLIMALLAAFLVWAYFAQMDEFASAEGEVVPIGQVKVVQHLEGGAIREILVTDGAPVKSGQVLLRLDLSVTNINPAELQVRLDGLLLAKARLLAESEGGELAFPEDLAGGRPDLVAAERAAFKARRQQLASTLEVLRSQVRQRELDIKELQAARGAFLTDLGLAKKNLAMSQELLKDELTSKMDHLKLVREVEALSGRLDALAPTVPRAREALGEAVERLKEEKLRFRRAAREELGAAELNIARTRELLSEASQQVRRADIRSPIDGTVKGLRYHTIGGVVRPGEPIMEIVPTSENLVVEAKLNPIDRGYVKVGLPAVVKLATYDFVRYGSLDGRVTQISADSVVGPEGEPYYKVVVETDKAFLGDDPTALPILPGLTATVDIQTGQKSVMQYILRPMLKLRSEAFRER